MTRSLQPIEPTLHVYSDSSNHSFGGSYLHHSISSKFSSEQAGSSINNKELLAIYYTLSAFASELSYKNVLHFVDNKTAYFCLINKGSSCPFRDRITRKIFEVACSHKFTLQCSWLSTHENKTADRLSCLEVCNPQMEFAIPSDLLHTCITRLVDWLPDIDLFASFLNHKFPRYCSWRKDPFAYRCDAFTLDWSQFKCFIHSPYSCLGRALKRVEDQNIKNCIVLAPLFPSMHWFSTLMQMTRQPPLLLPVNAAKKLYLPWDSQGRHPLARHMRLVLVDICSSCYRRKASQPGQLVTLQTMDGKLVQLADIPLK